jgi:hypothetical protein
MVVSVWDVEQDSVDPPATLTDSFEFEASDQLEQPTIEVLPLAVVLPFASPEDAQILRVFRGRSRPRELEDYVEAAPIGGR